MLRIFRGVQALRGLAALSVVCGHAITVKPEPVQNAAEGALTILASGVDIFFVISGFIIAKTASSGRSAQEFALKRAVRIFPVYWFVLLAASIASHWISLSPEVRRALDLPLIFAWTYPNWYIAPAWSIAFELHFYLAVAAILAIAPGRLFELLFVAFCVSATAIIFHVPLGLYSHPLVFEFGAGVAIAYLVQKHGVLAYSSSAAPISAISFIVGWYWIFVRGSNDPQFARVLTYGLGAWCLVYAVVSAELNGARFPIVFERLGGISYSLYIVHYPLMKWLATFTELWQALPVVMIAVSILLSIAVGVVLHRIVELPLLNLSREFRPVEAAAAAATGKT